MELHSPVVSQQAWKSAVRLFMTVGFLLISALTSQHAAAESSGIYVAGQGATLEQTFGQALGNAKGKTDPFWIVAAGTEAGRLSKSRAGQELQRSFNAVRERGGIVYACRSDLLRAGITEEDLLDGVTSVFGYGAQEWTGLLPVRRTESVLPKDEAQSQRILKTCSGDLQAVSR